MPTLPGTHTPPVGRVLPSNSLKGSGCPTWEAASPARQYCPARWSGTPPCPTEAKSRRHPLPARRRLLKRWVLRGSGDKAPHHTTPPGPPQPMRATQHSTAQCRGATPIAVGDGCVQECCAGRSRERSGGNGVRPPCLPWWVATGARGRGSARCAVVDAGGVDALSAPAPWLAPWRCTDEGGRQGGGSPFRPAKRRWRARRSGTHAAEMRHVLGYDTRTQACLAGLTPGSRPA